MNPPRRGRGWAVSVPCVGVSLAAALVVATGCPSRPTPGQPCGSSGALRCQGRHGALVCESGSWREVTCRGPRGCGEGARTVDDCDDSLASLADPCAAAPSIDYACSVDRADALECRGGRFVLWRHCRGERACAVDANRRVDCDTTLGDVGDPCGQPGTYACEVDRVSMLQCRGSSLVVASACRGPAGCMLDREGHRVGCDDSVALEGDACEVAGRVACAADGGFELACERTASGAGSAAGGDGALSYQKKRDCRHKGCRVEGTALFCD